MHSSSILFFFYITLSSISVFFPLLSLLLIDLRPSTLPPLLYTLYIICILKCSDNNKNMAKKSPEDQNEIPFLEKFMVSQTYDIFRFGGEEIKNDEVGIQRMLQNFSGLLTEEQIRENMKKYNLPKMFELCMYDLESERCPQIRV